MKKKIFKSLLAIICLLCSTNASAYDFEVDGIYYNVVSLSELTCQVTNGISGSIFLKYKGDIVIPATVKYANRTLTVIGIENDIFKNGYGSDLTGITIPNTISSIKGIFSSCPKLERVTIEDGETTLEVNGNWKSFPIITLYIGRNLSNSPFYNNETIKELSIGNSVTEIGERAFRYCRGLTSVTIGNSVTKIGESAFEGCSRLTSVTIPNSVTEIGKSAFESCYGLTSVTIPNSVTEIGGNAFYGCSGLTTLYSLSTTPPKIGSFENNHYMTLNVFVPQEALEAYQNDDIWKNFWNLQGFDATGIENVKAKGNAVYHDLRGIQFDAPKRGLNIINGKKVIIK